MAEPAWAKAMRVGVIGTEFVFTVIGAVALGWVIDWAAGTSPWFTVICALLGIVAAFVRFVREGTALASGRSKRG